MKTKEKITFTTTLIPLNVKNLKGRMYKDNENLRKHIAEFNEKSELMGVVYGEYNFPESYDTSLSRVSHSIKNVRIENDKVIGDITILDRAQNLKENYKKMFFRPRLVGITHGDGTVVITKLFTFDATDQDDFIL